MTATTTRTYLELQLKAARSARSRIESAATNLFGNSEGREIVERIALRMADRTRHDNPDVFGAPASGRRTK